MDERLCGTSLTGAKLGALLAASPEAHMNGHKLRDVEATVVGDGQGFTSKVMRVYLKWTTSEKSTTEPPNSIIVKVICSQALTEMMDVTSKEEQEKVNKDMQQLHDVECAVYELQELPALMNLPICYLKVPNTEDTPGVIALEDLGDRAVAMPPKQIGIGVNELQLDHMLEALTSLHAWSVNTAVDWPRSIPTFKDSRFMQGLYERLANTYANTKEAYPHAFENIDEEKLKRYLNYEELLKVFGCDPRVRYNLPRVLVHGDLHFVNMVWEKRADGSYGDRLVAVIDWQLAHQGCAMEDLARLLAMSVSVGKKRQYRDYIVRRYVELFNAKAKEIENRITYENTKRAFDEFFAYTATIWGCCLTMLDGFTKQVHNCEEERIALRDRIVAYNIDNFQDARQILGL